MNSRRKGANFERKLAHRLNEYGFDCRRGQQYCGLNGDADVIGLPKIHIEAKAVERLNIYDAMDQSKRDMKNDEIPVVMHKKNRQEILVTMELLRTKWLVPHSITFSEVLSNVTFSALAKGYFKK